jgi:hypothetical protein
MLMLPLTLGMTLAQQSSPYVVLDSTRQLFLDDWLIESKRNVVRRIRPADKSPHNPVLWPDEEWEADVAVVYGSVLRDGKWWRMWYQSGGDVSYAEGDDGLVWRKPRFDLVTLDGHGTNIIVRQGAGEGQPGALPWFYEVFGVHKDTRDGARPFKMGYLSIQRDYSGPGGDPFHGGQRRGLGVADSADGIHFASVNPWATEAIVDGATHWMFDAASARYVLYGRTKHISDEIRAAWGGQEWSDRHWGRAVARVESPDFLNWDVTDARQAPVVLAVDPQDRLGDEIYSMLVFPYEGIYIGLVQVFHNHPDDCTLDIQLAVSRDTKTFERVGDRAPFVPLGGVGEWDRFNLSLANNPPIEVGDDLRFYYGGRTYRHSPYDGPDKGDVAGGIGFATTPRDRFVSLDATFETGEVLTRPVVLQGRSLHLNIKSDFGEARVEALSETGAVMASSEPVRADSLDARVRWTGDEPFGTDSPVRLRIALRNAQLYAVWCGRD